MKIKKIILTAALAVLAVGMAGCTAGNSAADKNGSSSSSSNSQLAEDEVIIKDAQSLNADGHYKASNKKLSSIDIADLSKKGFGSLKSEYFHLQKSNDKFLLKDNKSSKSTNNGNNTSNNNTTSMGTNNSFSSFSKFTGDYVFYNSDSDRQQMDLTISSDGSVVQHNNDGSAFYGTAVASGSSQSGILSYDVTTGTNDTKKINANVEIDVTWDNGEHETYYGYTSYDDDIVLTDGNSYHGDLVNEVWIK